jgi:hypothetical protein
VSEKTPPPRPAEPSPPPSSLGHNYCWVEHPRGGGRCTEPRGHRSQGTPHHDPYAKLTWS